MNKLLYLLLFAIGSFIISSCNNRANNAYRQQSIRAADSITLIKIKQADVCQISITNPSVPPIEFYLTPANYNFQNYQTLLADIIKPGDTDKEKAAAIWLFTKSWTYHSLSAMQQRMPHDPLRLFNSFEGGLCDDRNAVLTNLFLLAGLKAHAYHLEGHVVAEVFYENAWHMYDADWGLYFKDDKENVASVEYLSDHPEAICKERSSGGEGWLKFSIGMQILKRLYSTKANNYVNTWYTDVPLNYDNRIQLAKGDELKFSYSKADALDKLTTLLGQHAMHNTKRIGILNRRIANWNTTHKNTNEWVMTENLPYAIKKVSINAVNRTAMKGNIEVYYSPDSVLWYYKGVITRHFGTITFNVFDTENQPVVFNYFIKLIGADGKDAVDNGALAVENDFLFSDKLFLNADNAFKLVYLQPQQGGYLNVNCKAEDEQ